MVTASERHIFCDHAPHALNGGLCMTLSLSRGQNLLNFIRHHIDKYEGNLRSNETTRITQRPLHHMHFLQNPTHFSDIRSRPFPDILHRVAVTVYFASVSVLNFCPCSSCMSTRSAPVTWGKVWTVGWVFYRCLPMSARASSSHAHYPNMSCLEAETPFHQELPSFFPPPLNCILEMSFKCIYIVITIQSLLPR
jgi:hypothetical protein